MIQWKPNITDVSEACGKTNTANWQSHNSQHIYGFVKKTKTKPQMKKQKTPRTTTTRAATTKPQNPIKTKTPTKQQQKRENLPGQLFQFSTSKSYYQKSILLTAINYIAFKTIILFKLLLKPWKECWEKSVYFRLNKFDIKNYDLAGHTYNILHHSKGRKIIIFTRQFKHVTLYY